MCQYSTDNVRKIKGQNGKYCEFLFSSHQKVMVFYHRIKNAPIFDRGFQKALRNRLAK
ncbi:MAG: hypothetical protein Q4A81_02780 [Pasteurellaceae bacterium]|nr:hypothetical protein [Pasteurellaceae bacterium]